MQTVDHLNIAGPLFPVKCLRKFGSTLYFEVTHRGAHACMCMRLYRDYFLVGFQGLKPIRVITLFLLIYYSSTDVVQQYHSYLCYSMIPSYYIYFYADACLAPVTSETSVAQPSLNFDSFLNSLDSMANLTM